jgi:hypothetical protein
MKSRRPVDTFLLRRRVSPATVIAELVKAHRQPELPRDDHSNDELTGHEIDENGGVKVFHGEEEEKRQGFRCDD